MPKLTVSRKSKSNLFYISDVLVLSFFQFPVPFRFVLSTILKLMGAALAVELNSMNSWTLRIVVIYIGINIEHTMQPYVALFYSRSLKNITFINHIQCYNSLDGLIISSFWKHSNSAACMHGNNICSFPIHSMSHSRVFEISFFNSIFSN